ncbi:MAG: hypothetical protein ACRDNL_03510, partial [Spirillospora sp.]
MSELNGSGGPRGAPDAATPWPAMGRDPGRAPEGQVPAAQQPIQMSKPPQPGQPGQLGQPGQPPQQPGRPRDAARAEVEAPEAQPWDIVERLRQMADLIGDALAAGERKVSEAQSEVASQVASVQAEKENAQRDAAAAWGEVQRARGQAEQAERRAVEAQNEAATQVASVTQEKESAQRDAAAAWGEVQRAR